MTKKTLSLILIFILMFSIIPVNIYAQDVLNIETDSEAVINLNGSITPVLETKRLTVMKNDDIERDDVHYSGLSDTSFIISEDGKNVTFWGGNNFNTYGLFPNKEVASMKIGYYAPVFLYTDKTVEEFGLGLAFPVKDGKSPVEFLEDMTDVVKIDISGNSYLQTLATLQENGNVNVFTRVKDYFITDVPGEATDIIDIAVGTQYVTAVRNDGHVIVWGREYYDSNGDNVADQFFKGIDVVNNEVLGLDNIVKISTFDNGEKTFALCLNSNGEVVSLGENPDDINSPSNLIPRLKDKTDVDFIEIIDVKAGRDIAAAINSNGELIVWGKDYTTKLDTELLEIVECGTSPDWALLRPKEEGVKFNEISVGRDYVLALLDNGIETAFGGNNNDGELDVPSKNITMSLKGDRLVKAIKGQDYIDLGIDIVDGLGRDLSNDVSINGLPIDTSVEGINKITYAYDDKEITRYVIVYPKDIDADIAKEGAVYIDDGEVTRWGNLVDGIDNTLTSVKQIKFGGYTDNDIYKEYAIALKNDNSLLTYGDVPINYDYQLENIKFNVETIEKVFANGRYMSILGRNSMEENSFSIITNLDFLFDTTGDNIVSGFDCVMSLIDKTLIDFAGYENGLLTLNTEGKIIGFADGMEPYNVQIDLSSAEEISELTDIVDVALSGKLGVAIKSDSSLVCWTNETDGLRYSDDYPILDETGFIKVEAGKNHILLLKEDGTVRAFGVDGDDSWKTNQKLSVPTNLYQDGNVIDIKAFGNTSLALMENGTVYIWGDDTGGKISDIPEEIQYKPAEIEADLALVYDGDKDFIIYDGDTTKEYLECKLIDRNTGQEISPNDYNLTREYKLLENDDDRVLRKQEITYKAEFPKDSGTYYTTTRNLITRYKSSIHPNDGIVQRIFLGEEYIDGGAIAIKSNNSNVVMDDVVINSSGTVDTNKVGVYEITYSTDIESIKDITKRVYVYDNFKTYGTEIGYYNAILDNGYVKIYGGFSDDLPDYYHIPEYYQGNIIDLDFYVSSDKKKWGVIILTKDGIIYDSSINKEMQYMPYVVDISAGKGRKYALDYRGGLSKWSENDIKDEIIWGIKYVYSCKDTSYIGKNIKLILEGDTEYKDAIEYLADENSNPKIVKIAHDDSYPIVLFEDGTAKIVGYDDETTCHEEYDLSSYENITDVEAWEYGYLIVNDGKLIVIAPWAGSLPRAVNDAIKSNSRPFNNNDIKYISTSGSYNPRITVLYNSGYAYSIGVNIPEEYQGGTDFYINGDSNIDINVGSNYIDEGATIFDNENNEDISDEIVVTGLPINTLVPGEYEVIYAYKNRTLSRKVKVKPIELTDMKDVITIVTGDHYLATLSSDNIARIQGKVYYISDNPSVIYDVKKIAGGDDDLLVLKNDGSIEVYGYYYKTPEDLGNVIDIYYSNDMSIAVNDKGEIKAWGYYTNEINKKLSEVIIPSKYLNDYNLIILDNGIFLSYGYSSIVITKDKAEYVSYLGDVKATDDYLVVKYNSISILEKRYSGYRQYPFKGVDIALPPAMISNTKKFATGKEHIISLLRNGNIVGYGDNTYGQLDPPSGLKDIISVYAEGDNSYAMDKNGKIYQWGKKSSTYRLLGRDYTVSHILNYDARIVDMTYSIDGVIGATETTNKNPVFIVKFGHGEYKIKYAQGDKKSGYFKTGGIEITDVYKFSDLSLGMHTIYVQDKERNTKLIKFEVKENDNE